MERIEVELAGVGDGRDLQRRAGLLAHQLPRHDVGVVLHPRDQDLVAWLQVRARPALRDQVDRIGAPAREDDLAAVRRVDQALHLHAGAFVRLGRAFAQQMRRAMDVRVVVPVVVVQRVQDLPRLLRRVGVVEVDQRPAVHDLAEDGEVRPDLLDVEGRGFSKLGHGRRRSGGTEVPPYFTASAGIAARSQRSRRVRSGSNFTRPTMSPAKLRMSIERASARVMPRACR